MRNNCSHRWAQSLLCVASLFLIIITAQAYQINPSIVLDVNILRSPSHSESGIFYITISNFGTKPIDSLNLTILSTNGPITNVSLSSLVQGQSQVATVTIPPSDLEQFIIMLKYDEDTVEQSQVKSVELRTSSEKSSFVNNVVLPALFGSLITLIGIFVTAFLEFKKELRRSKFEWGKSLFERYEQEYRTFMTRVAGTTDANQINEFFKQLTESAFLPNHLRIKVDETINVLKNKDVNTEQKKSARNDLLCEFETFIKNAPFNKL